MAIASPMSSGATGGCGCGGTGGWAMSDSSYILPCTSRGNWKINLNDLAAYKQQLHFVLRTMKVEPLHEK